MNERMIPEGFERELDSLLCAVPAPRAPAGLADRVVEAALRRREPHPGRWVAAFAMAAACLALCVWVRQGSPWSSSPVIVSFKAEKAAVKLGEPIVLTWDVRRAVKVLIQDERGVTIDPGVEKSIRLFAFEPGRHSYTMVAMGPHGTATRSLGPP